MTSSKDLMTAAVVAILILLIGAIGGVAGATTVYVLSRRRADKRTKSATRYNALPAHRTAVPNRAVLPARKRFTHALKVRHRPSVTEAPPVLALETAPLSPAALAVLEPRVDLTQTTIDPILHASTTQMPLPVRSSILPTLPPAN